MATLTASSRARFGMLVLLLTVTEEGQLQKMFGPAKEKRALKLDAA